MENLNKILQFVHVDCMEKKQVFSWLFSFELGSDWKVVSTPP